MQKSTSLDFEFGGEVMQIPIEWVGNGSAETDSPESRLLSDEGELQEGQEQDNTSEVAHSGESFTLT